MGNRELLALVRNGDKEAREKLISDNTGLVWSIVRRFNSRGYEPEDLFQIGCIGLIKAVDKFDDSFEVMFSTYAVPLIMGEIKRFMRDDGIIKVSRTLKENGWKINKAIQVLSQRLGREPTIEEISIETEILKEDITLALEANSEVESIYKSMYQSDGSEVYLIDQIKYNENMSENYEQIIDKMTLQQMIDELNEIEKQIILKRYFHEKTQTEIAKELGISQVQVSRLEKKILLDLRKKIAVS